MVAHTLFDKIWARHTVHEDADGTTLLYIDRHLIHEVTSPQAFEGLQQAGRRPRRPGTVLAVPDHNVPTTDRRALDSTDPLSRIQIRTLAHNCAEWGITMFSMDDRRQGIVHVVGPEQGFTVPGMTIVCGDSHTSTHGAFGALAFGIGTSEVEHVLATQCLIQKRPRTMEIRVDGQLSPHCSAKDMILAIIGRMGTAGGTGHVVEYAGEAIRALSMEGRMTLCNMTIEGGARAGMIAPDATTFSYIRGRPLAPPESLWAQAVRHWEGLCTDPGAVYDRHLTLAAEDISPQITWGTSPGMVTGVEGDDTGPGLFLRNRRAGGHGARRWNTWPSGRGRPWWTSKLTGCLSGRAQMRGLKIYAWPRPTWKGEKWPPACTPWSFPARAWSNNRRRKRGWMKFFGPPARNGGRPAVACVWP